MITRDDVEKEIYKMYKVHPSMKELDYKVSKQSNGKC